MSGPYPYTISQQYVTPTTLACQPTTANFNASDWISVSNGYEVKKTQTRKQIKMAQASAFKFFYGKPTYQPRQKKSHKAEQTEKLTRPLKYKNIKENLLV